MKRASLLCASLLWFLVYVPHCSAQWVACGYPLSLAGEYSFAVSDSDLFVGSFGFGVGSPGIVKTTDHGHTWIAANNGLNFRDIYSISAVKGGLFASASDGLYRSNDTGSHWILSNSGLGTAVIYAVTEAGPVLLAGTNGHVYRSTDGGATWTFSDAGLDTAIGSGSVKSFAHLNTAIFAATTAGIYRSTDSGKTWANAGLKKASITSIITHANALYVGTSWGVIHTTDLGDTWSEAGVGLASNDLVRALSFRGDQLFAGMRTYGIYRSTDSGITWSAYNSGFDPIGEVYALAVMGTDLFAGSSQGVWRLAFAASSGVPQSTDNALPCIYPNPTSGSIHISGIKDIRCITITDVLGRVALQKSDPGSEADLSSLAAGMYHLYIATSDNAVVQTVVRR